MARLRDHHGDVNYTATPTCPECRSEVDGYTAGDDAEVEKINLGERFGPVTLRPCGHVAWAFMPRSTESTITSTSDRPWYMPWR